MSKRLPYTFLLAVFCLQCFVFLPYFSSVAYCEDLSSFRIPKPGVEVQIWSDSAGVPHVVASSTFGVYWGFGYCLARDRLLQLELLRRSCRGTLAELFGKAFLDADALARRDAVSHEELSNGLSRAPAAFQEALKAFTMGLNEASAKMRSHTIPSDPAIAALGIEIPPFTELDVLEIFAGTMGARYNDFTQELDNLHLLSAMVKKFGARNASHIFEDVVFYKDDNVYTTLGNLSTIIPTLPGIPRLPAYVPGTEPFESPTLRTRKRNQILKTIGIPEKSGSYAAAISLRNFGKNEALLYTGPQMGYFSPSALYEIGLHTPDFDIVGTTPVGYVALLFAANRHIAFTATAGVGNIVDVLALHRSQTDPKTLIGEGFKLPVTVRTEFVRVKGLKKPVERKFEETPLGPVIAAEGPVVYVKQRAWKGRLVDSYASWFAANHAESLEEWLNAGDGMAISINWLGADREGHIAYTYAGCGKSRRSFGDDRLPTDKPTYFPYPDVRLAGTDPYTGFFVNWNCPPADGFRDGDMQTGWGADQRTKFLAERIEKGKNEWSVEFLKRLDKETAFTDLRAWFFKNRLLDCINEAVLSPTAAEALKELRNWNGLRTDDDGDGLLDEKGAGLFDVFWNKLFTAVFAPTLGDFTWMIASDPTWTQTALLFHILDGTARYDYLAGKTPQEVITTSFEESVRSLASAGQPLPLLPCPPMEFLGVNHVGAPTMAQPATFTPYMNRGSDVQIMQLSSAGIKIVGVLPPGNVAWGRHANDQIPLFKAFEWRERPLTYENVRRCARMLQTLKPNFAAD